MIIKKNNFILDHIGKKPVSSGLIIKKLYSDSTTEDIAFIFWDKSYLDCYIKTIKDNFQNNVVLYEDFKDFIYLVDEAYRLVSLTNNKNSREIKDENFNF